MLAAPATTVPSVPPSLAPINLAASVSPTALLAPARTSLTVRTAQLNVLEGRTATVSGTLTDAHHKGLARRVVVLQALGNHGWHRLARARTAANGRFRFLYRAGAIGSRRVRVGFPGDPFDIASRRPIGRLNVFRLAGASWYGGGGSLACGGTLTSSTLGVANKTLPCGTLITLRYGGRTVRVPVIDRGPYVEGREFDLTEATKQALGFGDTGDVWSTR